MDETHLKPVAASLQWLNQVKQADASISSSDQSFEVDYVPDNEYVNYLIALQSDW